MDFILWLLSLEPFTMSLLFCFLILVPVMALVLRDEGEHHQRGFISGLPKPIPSSRHSLEPLTPTAEPLDLSRHDNVVPLFGRRAS
ncbi:hypothetical protein [Pseudonocardia ailaonensis]|uniref:hypothetical protein n=1 Tax=Pseudonocardia ailaonensis TaxID=367279 RepID=UPI0031DFC0D9